VYIGAQRRPCRSFTSDIARRHRQVDLPQTATMDSTHTDRLTTGRTRVLRDRLDSWKEIADYLGRTVRTTQRWERLGLPVHRHRHNTGSSVYAFRADIDRWWTTRRPAHDTGLDPLTGADMAALEADAASC
jgi:hypothetical protein